MTDAHCHIRRGETRHFLCDPTGDMAGPEDMVFHGYHPWCFLGSGRVELETLNDPNLTLNDPNLTLNDPKLPNNRKPATCVAGFTCLV